MKWIFASTIYVSFLIANPQCQQWTPLSPKGIFRPFLPSNHHKNKSAYRQNDFCHSIIAAVLHLSISPLSMTQLSLIPKPLLLSLAHFHCATRQSLPTKARLRQFFGEKLFTLEIEIPTPKPQNQNFEWALLHSPNCSPPPLICFVSRITRFQSHQSPLITHAFYHERSFLHMNANTQSHQFFCDKISCINDANFILRSLVCIWYKRGHTKRWPHA